MANPLEQSTVLSKYTRLTDPPLCARPQNSTNTTITYNDVVAFVANLPSITPCPNFTNLCNLWRHIQHALKRLSCPQSNIFGWVGLIMALFMYALLTTTPFRLPTASGPLVIYCPPPSPIVDDQGSPVLDAAGQPMFVVQPTIGCAEQSIIDAHSHSAIISGLVYKHTAGSLQHPC